MSDFWGLISEKLRDRIEVYVVVQFLVYHANGRGATAGKAFNKFDAVISIGANRNGIVHSLALVFALNSSRCA
jgi:hypothetical protein